MKKVKLKKYFLWVLGCAMNLSDAERIDAVMAGLGYSKTLSENKADIIITVACSVRQSAIDRIWGRLNNWQKIKKNRSLLTILTGCVLDKDKANFIKKFDHYLPIKNLDDLPNLIAPTRGALQSYKNYLEIQPQHSNNFQALLPIMTGCNNFCAYCAVPYVRGREKSRSPHEIIKEFKNLVKNGFKEITLVGQNVNSYKYGFLKLLKKLDAVQGDYWLKFVSPHPKDTTRDLIDFIASSQHICHHIHLPLQAGSNRILNAMNRPYTQKQYLDLVAYIYKKMPDCAITTDVIVGFPCETKKDFLESAKVFKKAKFAMGYLAQYSPRPQTQSAKLADNVSKKEKKYREEKLNDVLRKTSLEFNKKYLNRKIKILLTKKGYFGITEHSKNIQIKSNKKLTIGEFYDILITQAEPWRLSGKI